jgi:hypothetical protein
MNSTQRQHQSPQEDAPTSVPTSSCGTGPVRCLCGRGKYYHPWRFCDEYRPAARTNPEQEK